MNRSSKIANRYILIAILFCLCLIFASSRFPTAKPIHLQLSFQSNSPSMLRIAYDTGYGYNYLQSRDMTSKPVGSEPNILQEITGLLPYQPLKGLKITHLSGQNKFTEAILQTDEHSLNLDIEKLSNKEEVTVSKEDLETLQGKVNLLRNSFQFSPILLALSLTLVISLLVIKVRTSSNLLKNKQIYCSLGIATAILLMLGGSQCYLPIHFILQGGPVEGEESTLALLSLETGYKTHPSNRFLVSIDNPQNSNFDISVIDTIGSKAPPVAGTIVADGIVTAIEKLSKRGQNGTGTSSYAIPPFKGTARINLLNNVPNRRITINSNGKLLHDITPILNGPGIIYILSSICSTHNNQHHIYLPWDPYNINLTALKVEFPSSSNIPENSKIEISVENKNLVVPEQEIRKNIIYAFNLESLNGRKFLFNYLIDICFVVSFTFFTLGFWIYWKKIKSYVCTNSRQSFIFCSFFIFSSFVYLIYLIALFPGSYTTDSTYTWSYARTPFIGNWQPLLYTFYSGLTSLFSESTALNASIQITLTAALISAITCCSINKTKSYLPILSFLWASSSILISLYNLIFWKDVLYGILLVTCAFIVYYYKDKKLEGKSQFYILALLLFLLASFRHNGFILIAGYPLILCIYKILTLRRSLELALVSFALFCVFNLGIGSILGAHDRTDYTTMNLSVRLNHVQSILKANSTFDKSFISEVAEPNIIQERGMGVIFDPKSNQLADKKVIPKIDKLIIENLLHNPLVIVVPVIELLKQTIMGEGYLWDNNFSKAIPNYAEYFALIPYSAYFRPLSSDINKLVEDWSGLPSPERNWSIYFILNFTALIQVVSIFISLILFKFAPRTASYSSVLLLGLVATIPSLQATDFRYIYFLYLGGIFVPGMLLGELRNSVNRFKILSNLRLLLEIKSIALVLMLTLFFSLILIISRVNLPFIFSPSETAISIRATGVKGSEGVGTEVWLYSIKKLGGDLIPWKEVTLSKGWELRDTVAVSFYSQPNVATWSGSIRTPIEIYFGSHQQSGNVSIATNDGRSWNLNLYSKVPKPFEKLQIDPIHTIVDRTLSALFFSFLFALGLSTLLIRNWMNNKAFCWFFGPRLDRT